MLPAASDDDPDEIMLGAAPSRCASVDRYDAYDKRDADVGDDVEDKMGEDDDDDDDEGEEEAKAGEESSVLCDMVCRVLVEGAAGPRDGDDDDDDDATAATAAIADGGGDVAAAVSCLKPPVASDVTRTGEFGPGCGIICCCCSRERARLASSLLLLLLIFIVGIFLAKDDRYDAYLLCCC
jgi:hypothetical protein